MKLTFTQTRQFVDDCKRLKVNDDDVSALEQMLLVNPEIGDRIAGAGGLRKVRFAPPSLHTGKSGANRVGYFYFVKHDHVFLMVMFGKREQANLTPSQKAALREQVGRINAALNK